MNPAADRIQDAARFDQTISALASGRRPARRCRAVICADIRAGRRQRGPAASPAVEAYIRARTAYEQEAEAYWQSIADKRRARFAKRRSGEPIVLDDYVLTQPPVYTGPPRPPDYVPPHREPERPPVPVPTIPDFLAAAKEQYNFVPDRPKTEQEFKQAYAKAAAAAGLTREQAVRIYAFETGGNGDYDTQAGQTSNKNAQADLARHRLQPASRHQLGEPARRTTATGSSPG